MKLFKAKAPFFNGSYYKELFNELKVIGIICAVLQLYYGVTGAFGIGSSPGTGALFMFTFGSVNVIHQDIFTLFFFACGFQFCSTHVWRKNWDFRNSIPVAKRTMFSCHFAAVLTWAAIIFVANYIGAFIGEGLRLVIKTTSIPDGFGLSAVSMLKSAVSGVSIYCMIVILVSIVNRVFPALAAIGVAIGLPILFVGFQSYIRYHGMETIKLLLPFGIDGLAAFRTISSIVCMIALAVLAYIAYGKSRVETFQRSARTAWINVLIGLGVAACVGIIAAIIIEGTSGIMYLSSDGELYKTPQWYLCLAFAFIPMIIAYFIYMWITERSFTKALKKLVFAPIALLVFGAAILVAMIADSKWEKLDFSASNIDSVRFKDEYFMERESYDGSFLSGGYTKRGSSKAFRVKHTDEKVIKYATNLANSARNYYDNGIGSRIEEFFMGVFRGDTVEITLKDGSKWGFNPWMDGSENLTLDDVSANKEYIDALASLDRFGNGKVLVPVNFGAEFNKTLLDELATLSSEERAKILTQTSNIESYYDYAGIFSATAINYQGRIPEWSTGYGFRLCLVSPTYDHLAYVELSEKLPKTTEMFMKLSSENTMAHRDYNEFISKLKTADFWDFIATVSFLRDGKMISTRMSLDGAGYSEHDSSYTKDYVNAVKQISALVAECLEQNAPIENAHTVFGFNVSRFLPRENRNGDDRYWMNTILFEDTKAMQFVGLTAEQAERLEKLINDFVEKYLYGGFSYDYTVESIVEAIEQGELKLYNDDYIEITSEEFVEMYTKGYEWFCVEGGYSVHIGEIYDKLMQSRAGGNVKE